MSTRRHGAVSLTVEFQVEKVKLFHQFLTIKLASAPGILGPKSAKCNWKAHAHHAGRPHGVCKERWDLHEAQIMHYILYSPVSIHLYSFMSIPPRREVQPFPHDFLGQPLELPIKMSMPRFHVFQGSEQPFPLSMQHSNIQKLEVL